MSHRLIVGYDDRQESQDALDLAIVIAEALEATLVVAAISTKSTPVARGAPSSETAPGLAGAGILADAEHAIGAQAPTLKVETRTVEARTPAKGLRELAQAQISSLVVVGSSHRGRLARIMLGSTAEQLCRDSPCPVAIAPRGYRQRSAKELRVIGVAFDARHDARRALAVAIALAERVPAGLRVFGVLEPVGLHGAAVPPVDIGSTEPRFNREVLDQNLQQVVADLPAEIAGQKVILEGEPVDALVESGERATDLLVLGSRPKGRLAQLLPDSVSFGVAAAAPWPVIVVPARAGLAPLMDDSQSRPFKE
jgi:nucleotide-binding universal stress UspA family protein